MSSDDIRQWGEALSDPAFVSVPHTFHFDVDPASLPDAPPMVLAPRSAAVAHLQAENARLRALANRLTTDNATLAARLDAAEERGAGDRLSAGWHHLPDVTREPPAAFPASALRFGV